jgi:hypothetical protein
MKRAIFLAVAQLTMLPAVTASAITVAPSGNGGGMLAPDRDASANWSSAGMLTQVHVPVERDHGFRWKMITQSGGT